MRVEGEWGRSNAPYIEVILVCEELGIAEPVKFLIDTGASTTHVLDRDAKRLKVDFRKLTKRQQGTTGVGGVVEAYIIPNVKFYFRTPDGIHQEKFDEIYTLRHRAQNEEEERRMGMLPSLLGRDFINRYRLILDKANDRVTITDEAE